MISGIFENCIGSSDIEAALQYWAEFGYREIQRGDLSANAAAQLYGYSSDLTAIRLQNGQAQDHGLIRVMQWQEPRNPGLGNALPLTIGSRWFASLVQDIFTVADAYSDDKALGGNWLMTEPTRAIEGVGKPATSFYDRFVGVRELFVIGAETRQAFFQRYNYTRPGYGTISPDSPLGASEGTHSSIVTADHTQATFYAEVFGLVPLDFNGKRSGYQNPSTRQTLMLDAGQEFYLSAFVSPNTTVGMLQVYSPLYATPDQRDLAQPGALGLSLFTYQVQTLQPIYDRVHASAATAVTPITQNEFGEPSFGLIAPDGTYWVIVEG
ncbi:MAG: hypothetical protein NW224_08105 [Leptolyngbyaceae cyanobacterium bins.302]|nr:hypothetical protein [Leptolyngbyaceae cyanobacterium bins.302]